MEVECIYIDRSMRGRIERDKKSNGVDMYIDLTRCASTRSLLTISIGLALSGALKVAIC